MADFKDRLMVEHAELRDRTEKLSEFCIDFENSTKMDMHDWNILLVQKDIMVSYLGILESRMIKLGILPIEED